MLRELLGGRLRELLREHVDTFRLRVVARLLELRHVGVCVCASVRLCLWTDVRTFIGRRWNCAFIQSQ